MTITTQNPIRRGAAIDWKATAEVIETQLSLSQKRVEAGDAVSKARLSSMERVFREVQKTWWFHLFAPAYMKTILDMWTR